MANPRVERAVYEHDVDKTMELLKIHAAPGAQQGVGCADVAGTTNHSRQGSTGAYACGRGLISWFPVHCTSMNNTNPFVSGDNKGAAAQLSERAASQAGTPDQQLRSSTQAPHGWLTATWHSLLLSFQRWTSWHTSGIGWTAAWRQTRPSAKSATARQTAEFVAAFAQSSVGDTSPNVLGAYCLDTGVQYMGSASAIRIIWRAVLSATCPCCYLSLALLAGTYSSISNLYSR